MFARPMGFAETLRLRLRIGDLDLPKIRKRYTSSRKEEVDAHLCPCGKAIESRTHIAGTCGMYKEERDVLEEGMREVDKCNMEEFGTLDSSDETIAILGDTRWPQAAKQEGDKISKRFLCSNGKNVMNAQTLEVPVLGVGTVLRLEREAWPMAKRPRQATK